ncbi:chemotaxis protein CheW [cf. Phormidesmis sp. LEGE 11477]|uniref:chemotaxis protein CheW n=1 Tax=cf. Phormidesmis sp. LEGE 11477 TaxID=1828680 RepID=UPI001882898A|nr:chemotaxis protein CheW [cf. Phormidesmis sp. LEGE 11477]MBE9064310.1 chemotaxis protein CheW [cf. Phormidesmis sp. LEGE 11477]
MVGNPDFQTISGKDQAPELQEIETPEGELHLRFFVADGNEFALPATGIRRIIEHAPDHITPVPNVSPLLLGTLNQQGRVIWVADLGQFLGCAKSMNTDRAEIPVIAVEEQGTMLGLAVSQVVGTDWLDTEALKATANPSDVMAPFLKGEWPLEADTPLKLLDHVAILRSARWVA